jgi:hypothetical protein
MMSPGMMGPAIMRMILALMDTDGDGTVSLSEFQIAHERIFKALDANKDGSLWRKCKPFSRAKAEWSARKPSPRNVTAAHRRGDPRSPTANPANSSIVPKRWVVGF